MKNKEYTYSLECDLELIARQNPTNAMPVTKRRDMVRRLIIDLENKHGTNKLFTNPLHVQFTAYFRRVKTNQDASETMFLGSVFLSNLVSLIELIGKDILFSNQNIITSINGKKVYSDSGKSCLDITIAECHEDK